MSTRWYTRIIRIRRRLGLSLALMIVALSACTINIGDTREEAPDQSEATTLPEPEAATTSIASPEVPKSNPNESWDALVTVENPLSQSEVAFTGNGMFGLLAAPELRLYKFSGGSWIDIPGDDLTSLNPLSRLGLDPRSLDYDITIQSIDLTGDGSVDFIISFRPAPWDRLDAPNQGRYFGSVLSCDEGDCRSLPFWEPVDYTAGGTNHFTVEYIEWIDGTLFASWFGSCGRPCGLLIYEWVSAYDRFEGKEANDRQRKETERLNCIDYRYSFELPLALCDKGPPVEMVQSQLQTFGYNFEVDGFFGADTRLAVKLFQKAQGIRVTGEVDAATWRMLFEGMMLPGHDLNGDGYVDPSELSGT